MPDLEHLSTLDDDEADSLVRGMEKRHGIESIATLLDWVTRWDARHPLPPIPVPAEMLDLAREFLAHPEIFNGAFSDAAVDRNCIKRSQELFKKHPKSGLMVLGCASLPACYAYPNIALLLTGSGRLAVQVTRRLRETIDFLQVVMTPGSLDPGGLGVKWIRKVRLMHALMRVLALADALRFKDRAGEKASDFLLRLDWKARQDKGKPADRRKPIDQPELAYVLLTFSWLLVRGFGELGISMNDTQKDDYIYTWAVIGHGLGIREDLRPRSAAKAQELFEQIEAARARGTEEGRLLTAALMVFIVIAQQEQVKEFPAWAQSLYRRFKPFLDACFQSLARTLIRDLVGRQTAESLWVPRAPLLHWLVGWVLRAGMTMLEMRLPEEKGLPRALGASLETLVARQ